MVENLPVAFFGFHIWFESAHVKHRWTAKDQAILRSLARALLFTWNMDWHVWLSSQKDITVKKPRTNKYTCFPSRMKWTENNLCLSWILMRGGATVHFASGQLCHGSSKMPIGASPTIVCDRLGIFRCPRSGYYFITCTVHVMYFNVVSFSNILNSPTISSDEPILDWRGSYTHERYSYKRRHG